jgi:hypothetical protein
VAPPDPRGTQYTRLKTGNQWALPHLTLRTNSFRPRAQGPPFVFKCDTYEPTHVQYKSPDIKNTYSCTFYVGVSVGAVGYRTVLQTGRSRVRFPMMSFELSLTILPVAVWPWGWLSLLTEMSTKNNSWRGKGGRCVGLTLPPSFADCLEIWEPQPPRPVQARNGIALPLHFMLQWTVIWETKLERPFENWSPIVKWQVNLEYTKQVSYVHIIRGRWNYVDGEITG